MGLRHHLERASRGVVLKRHLPSEFLRLPIYVSPDASLRYWLPISHSDPMLFRMARELVKPSASVWDVGANVGLFSVCASALAGEAGHVLAIEPDVRLCQLIAKSATRISRRGGTAPIDVLCAAVSSTEGVSRLLISDRSRAANHLQECAGSSQAMGARAAQPTVTVSLDALLPHFPPPSVLKIDVETHELEVLRGAAKLLRISKPTIWCEVCPERSVEVFQLLDSIGYTLYAAATPGPDRTRLSKRASWDTLALPGRE